MIETSVIHILLADDDKELCEEIIGALTATGFDAKCVHTGEDALKTVQKENFDIILLDLKMPGMGGLAAFSEIKKINPSMPVMMITGALPPSVVEKFKKTSFTSVMYKPFDVEELIKNIQALLNR